jgi:DMSO reductase anchor subunit
MHPAASVIFFTVFSGAGFGLLILMGFATYSSATPSTAFLVVHFGLAFAMAVAGLISSTFHLGHPERAWRALTQWRSSWLSREGVLAVATLLIAGLYAFLWVFFDAPIGILGWVSAILALVTVYATGMIYAQIKAVQLWHRTLTPICYLLFSIAGGALLFLMLHAVFFGEAGSFLSSVAMVLLLVAWAVKIFWWMTGDKIIPLSTTGSATGLGKIGKTRLLEAPHTGENYLKKEMGFQIARKHASKLRIISVLLGAVLPIILILVALPAPADALWLILAVVSHLAGMLTERWLFFAEAKHAVMTFYQ